MNIPFLTRCNGKINATGFCDTCHQPAQTSSSDCNRLVPFEHLQKNIDKIKLMMDSLTESERMNIISNYCAHCGNIDPHCQCWNDE